MVLRYSDCAEGVFEDSTGEYVKYGDYAALHALMCRLTDQINICELPDKLYSELEARGLL